MATILTIKQEMASYLGKIAVADLNPTTDLGGINIDLALYALNQTRKKFERLRDWTYAQAQADISIATGGTLLTAATISAVAIVPKRVREVLLPIAGGQYIPIEFITNDEWLDRKRRAIGRTGYDPASTLNSLGVSDENPISYQHGLSLFLTGFGTFTFPVSARINVIRYMPDYTDDGDHDFFVEYGADALLWGSILEVNKLFRRFSNKQEGNLDEGAVTQMAQESLQTLMAWDDSIRADTSTPGGQ